MAKVLHIAGASRNTMLDALTATINSGTVKVYDGTMPASVATAVTDQTLLATLTLGSTAFGSAVSGVATANAITSDSSADDDGTATWARISTSGGTAVMDVNVGTSGDDAVLTFNTTSFVSGAEIAMTSFTLTLPSGE